jgi:hypothetical protein
MEGSGEEGEPQGLAYLAREFNKSINQTESKLVMIPYYQSEGSHGEGTPHGQMGSRATPRPYLPTFTDGQSQREQVDDFLEQMVQCTRQYHELDLGIQR